MKGSCEIVVIKMYDSKTDKTFLWKREYLRQNGQTEKMQDAAIIELKHNPIYLQKGALTSLNPANTEWGLECCPYNLSRPVLNPVENCLLNELCREGQFLFSSETFADKTRGRKENYVPH